MASSGQFAIITGASTGIGFELARCCANDGFDLLIAADEQEIEHAAADLGFDAMMAGEGDVVAGLKNKIQSSVANVTPAGALAKQHRAVTEPGTAKQH